MVLLIGAEDTGLDATWRELADATVSIPMRGATTDSLNAATSAAVLLFEARRQRSLPDSYDPTRARPSRPDPTDVEQARATIGDRLPRTPLLSNRTLGARLKCELFQRTGSFKVRGALNKISSLTDEEKRNGVIAISAGNHAQATAYAAAEEGIDALVVMWQGASEQKIEATRGYGATVDLEASGPGDAFARLESCSPRPAARSCTPSTTRS